MNDFIRHQSSGRQEVRIWGTFTPTQGANISKSVSYQHWDLGADQPYHDYIQNGYNVLNSDDYLYLVGGWSPSFPQELELGKIFQGPRGAPYSPVIFDSSTARDNPPRNNPRVLGQVAALWNDFGPNSTTALQAYYSWRNALPALADKQWGGDSTQEEYISVFDRLQAAIPRPKSTSTVVKDCSGNGYHGAAQGCRIADRTLHLADGCYLETLLGSKGRDYTLSFRVKPTSSMPSTLFAGPNSRLVSGMISHVTMISGRNLCSLNYTVPLQVWTDISLVGRGNATLPTVSSKGERPQTMEFRAVIGVNGESMASASIGVEAPLARVGEGFSGMMQGIALTSSAA